PDRFEPNDTVAAATNLGTVSSVSQTGLTLHTASDVDYFKLTAASKGTFVVSVTPPPANGPLSLAVLNAQQTVLATGQSQTGAIPLSVSLASGQQYYVKILSPAGSLLTYDLTVAKSGGGGKGSKGGALTLAPAGASEETQSGAPQLPAANGSGSGLPGRT